MLKHVDGGHKFDGGSDSLEIWRPVFRIGSGFPSKEKGQVSSLRGCLLPENLALIGPLNAVKRGERR